MTSWLVKVQSNSLARMRLFCLPFAGGAASIFQSWNGRFSSDLEICAVQPPGRQARATETPYTRMTPFVHELTNAITDHIDLPYVIFGNCTGSLTAYEIAVRCRQLGLREPEALIVSCCRAPHLPDRDAPIHQLSDEKLRDALKDLGGTDQSVLEHPQLFALIAPALRADFELAETYRFRTHTPLNCPIYAIHGEDDEIVSRHEVDEWRRQTSSNFENASVPGGHYLIDTHTDDLIAQLNDIISQITPHSQLAKVSAG